jgi:sugar lactone lactonase YvrE
MVSHNARLFLVATCAALTLGGCSASGSSGAPGAYTPPSGPSAIRHGWISRAAKKEKLLYVSDLTESFILIYQQGDTGAGPIGEIVNGISSPEGLAVDKSGTLYVANIGNNTVTEYPAGATSPSVTLSTDISNPLDVSVDSNDNVYVTESSAGEILEFEPGSSSPNETVSLARADVATNSKNDDVYVTHNVSSEGHVVRCKPLSSSCKNLGITVGFAQGIAIDSQGNLLVGDVYGGVIDIYHPKQTSPFRTISTYEEQPAKLALDSSDSTLYMADPANFAVRLFDYATGNQESYFTFGSYDELVGVALYPGQKPGK